MQPDKWYLSYRTYLAIIGVVATALKIFCDYELSEDMQKQIADFFMLLAPVIMSAMAIISKIRESNKIKK